MSCRNNSSASFAAGCGAEVALSFLPRVGQQDHWLWAHLPSPGDVYVLVLNCGSSPGRVGIPREDYWQGMAENRGKRLSVRAHAGLGTS